MAPLSFAAHRNSDVFLNAMETQTVTIEVAPQLAALLLTLQQRAEAQGKTLDAFLRELVEARENRAQTAVTPYELVADLIGAVDSSIPDPTSPPRHTTFGAHLLEKHHQEIKRSAALEDIAARQGVTPEEWVRQNFPNGRDSQGRLLAERLDTLILKEDSKADGTH